jgi:hypothetical protein
VLRTERLFAPPIEPDQLERQNAMIEAAGADAIQRIKLSKTLERALLNKNWIIHHFALTATQGKKMLIDHLASFKETIDDLIKELKKTVDNDDYIQFIVFSDNTEHPVSTKYIKFRHFNVSFLLTVLMQSSQSGHSLEFNHNIQLHVKHVITGKRSTVENNTSFTGGKKYGEISSSLALQQRKCIFQIHNPNDSMCMTRSLVCCLAFNKYMACEKGSFEKRLVYRSYKKIIRRGGYKQTEKALKMQIKIGKTPDDKCGIEEARALELEYGFNIKIIAADKFNKVVYDGCKENRIIREDQQKTPILYLWRLGSNSNEYHYAGIKNIRAFFQKRFFCEDCNVSFSRITSHKCEGTKDWCYTCYNPKCEYDQNCETELSCEICNASFRSEECKIQHLRVRNCSKVYFCSVCFENIPRKTVQLTEDTARFENNTEIRNRHQCKRICRVCKKDQDPFHKCYLQKVTYKEESRKYLFLDFETEQASGEHIPIFCHIRWNAIKNNNDPDNWLSKSFGLGENVINETCDFIFSKRFKGYTIIAHNMRGYDGCFLLRYLVANGTKPTMILRGKKILSFNIPKVRIRVIDSLNFLLMRLSDFSKAFKLTSEKGYFPHFFSKKENFDYVGTLPSPLEYGYMNMKTKERQEFLVWYQESLINGDIFNFREDIKRYCIQDVNLLQQGCWEFRNRTLELTDGGCDPFRYNTLASMCATIYKADYMPENTIAAVPPDGYFRIQNFSSKSLEWLEWLRVTKQIDLIHIGNSGVGEAKIIGGVRVDGLDVKNKTAYEFYGCYYHGCTKCYAHKQNSLNTRYNKTYASIYLDTMKREARLRIMGYKVISMWECEWEKLKKNNQIIQEFVAENEDRLKPLDPFDSFRGGRVEAFKLLSENDKLEYLDINSLYPYINANKKYPIDHPEIIFENFGDLENICNNFFGFIYCKIIPPRNLYIPVLPAKYGKDGKLLFTLCNTCAKREPRASILCNHSDELRSLTGVWFSEEMRLALEEGYIISEVYSIYNFVNSSTLLFNNYIKTFYKIKMLSSGKPEWCDSTEKFKEFCEAVKENEGIDLEGDSFEENSAIRCISKLMLNTLWGKFGTRRIHSKATICQSIDEVRELFENEKIEVINIIEMAEEAVVVITKEKKISFLDINNTSNIYIASATTAYARIELYKYLKMAGKNIVYCDTDSVIYKPTPECHLPTSEHLGGLKNELALGDYITHFVCVAAKVYAFLTAQNRVMIKAKGMSLSFVNSENLTFENLKKLVVKFASNEYSEDNFVQMKSNRELYRERCVYTENAKQRKHNLHPEEPSSYASEDYVSVYNPSAIKITPDWRLIKDIQQKILTCHYDKRLVMSDFDTVPFGFSQ